MSPFKTFLSILGLFAVLAFVAYIYPENGIQIGDTSLRYPKLTDIFTKADTSEVVDSVVMEDPEDAFREMMEATRQKEFSAYTDSLKYYEDFFQNGRTRIDFPNNDPAWFDRFFRHLQQAVQDSSTIHIIHYGDSQLEEDRITSTIRENLQSVFGGSGPGMLPPVMPVASITTSHYNNGGLQRYIIFGPEEEEANHNRYGPLAQFASLNGSAVISIKKRADKTNAFPHVGGYKTIKVLASKRGFLKLRLVYARTFVEDIPAGTDSTIAAKPPKIKVKNVEADTPSVESFNKLNVYTWILPDTTSSAKIYLNGNKEIYAISADGAYGVAVDNIAMRGSSGTVFHRIDSELLAESYKAMNARLIIMEYGGNIVPGTNKKNIAWSRKIISRQIQAIQKANPDADIIFFGPADMSKFTNGSWKTYPGLALAIENLRALALENGVAYWDMHRVMGGDGSMHQWVKKRPALGFTDHIHFTRLGASHMGDLFTSTLQMYYDYFQFRDKHNIDENKLNEIRDFADSLKIKDSLKNDTLNIDSLKTDSLKGDTLKAESLQVETSKADTLKADTLQEEALKANSLKADTLQVETSKADTLKADTSHVDSNKT